MIYSYQLFLQTFDLYLNFNSLRFNGNLLCEILAHRLIGALLGYDNRILRKKL